MSSVQNIINLLGRCEAQYERCSQIRWFVTSKTVDLDMHLLSSVVAEAYKQIQNNITDCDAEILRRYKVIWENSSTLLDQYARNSQDDESRIELVKKIRNLKAILLDYAKENPGKDIKPEDVNPFETTLDKCVEQLNQCRFEKQQWLGADINIANTLLKEKLKAAFQEIKENIAKCDNRAYQRYDEVWNLIYDYFNEREEVEYVETIERRKYFLSEMQSIHVNNLKIASNSHQNKRLIGRASFHTSLKYKEALVQRINKTATIIFSNTISMDQAREASKEHLALVKKLKGGNWLTNFILKILAIFSFNKPRYNALQRQVKEIESQAKLINKCMTINVLPHLGKSNDLLLFNMHHIYERMKYYNQKFKDPSNPTFDLAERFVLDDLVKKERMSTSDYLQQFVLQKDRTQESLSNKLRQIYAAYKDSGTLEIREVNSESLFKRIKISDLTEEEFIRKGMEENLKNGHFRNIQIIRVEKDISMETLKARGVLQDFQASRPVKEFIKPTRDPKTDLKLLSELYDKYRETGIIYVPGKKVKSEGVLLETLGKCQHGIVTKPTNAFNLSKIEKERFIELFYLKDEKKIKTDKNCNKSDFEKFLRKIYYENKTKSIYLKTNGDFRKCSFDTEDAFVNHALSLHRGPDYGNIEILIWTVGDKIRPDFSKINFSCIDTVQLIRTNQYDYYQDGFVKEVEFEKGRMIPHALHQKPQTEFTVEFTTKHDGKPPMRSGHVGAIARTPNGEEYSFGFVPKENYGMGRMNLQKGRIWLFDGHVFVPTRNKKDPNSRGKTNSNVIYKFADENAFNKFIEWVEKQKEQNPLYHPLYKNCACFAGDAADYAEQHCGAIKTESCTDGVLMKLLKPVQKIKRLVLWKALHFSQKIETLRKMVNVQGGVDLIDSSDPNHPKPVLVTIEILLGKKFKEILPYMPADFIMSH